MRNRNDDLHAREAAGMDKGALLEITAFGSAVPVPTI